MRSGPDLGAEAAAIADRIVERSALDGTDRVRAPVPLRREPSDPVGEALTRADEEFASLAFGAAQASIAQALTAIDDGATVTRATLLDVLLVASMIYGATGDTVLADRAAHGALAIDPTLEIDPSRYPPTLAARIDALRPAVARCPIALRLDPSDAALVIDGEPVSTLPTELGCGAHWLSATRVGYGPRTERVELGPENASAAIALVLTIDPASALALSGEPGTPVPALSERAAATLGRSLVVLDLVHTEDGALLATLGARSVRTSASSTPDEIAQALLAPIEHRTDTDLIVGVSVGVGAAVLAAIAIGLAVALAPSGSSGWTGIGEVMRP